MSHQYEDDNANGQRAMQNLRREEHVEAFLAKRPWYDREHVEEIALACQGERVPFCSECADWHLAGEKHSA